MSIATYACTETSGTVCTDASGNGNDATHDGEPDASGLYLGSDAYLDLPFSLSGRTSVTVSLFVYLDALSDLALFSTYGSSSANSLEITVSSLGVLRATQDDSYSIESGAVVTAGTFTHVAYTYNYVTTTQVLYINGSPVRYEASVPQFSYNTTNIVIGGRASKDSYKFVGRVKTVYVGSTALTPGAVEALYKQSDAALILPFGTVESKKISSAGDFVMRSVVTANLYQVQKASGSSSTQVVHETYVLDSGEASHATSVNMTIDADQEAGQVDVVVRESDTSTITAMSVAADEVCFANSEVRATVDTSGLKFDSNDACVYFGSGQEFRIRYESTEPARLAFEYYDSTSDSYLQGASFLK